MIPKMGMSPISMAAPNQLVKKDAVGAVDISSQFSSFLNNAIEKTKDQELAVDKLTEQFIRGDLTDVHSVLIAAEKASIGLELTVQVRNKVVEAYQEIMRMQI